MDNIEFLDEDVLSVVDISRSFEDEEVDVFSMASLGNYVLLGHRTENSDTNDEKLHRLSLAYEKLHTVPKILLQELAPKIKILDLSHNEFDNLDFLSEFKALTTFICDHNNISSNTNLPFLPTLELLWLNHCKVTSLYPWAKKLQSSCPNLKFLSLMGNPVAPSYLNGGNFYEYLQYRLFIISLFPKLVHLDDRPVNTDQRIEAERLYRKPLVERLVMNISTPEYLRHITEIFTPAAITHEKNLIV
ncbi:Leucine-rich repeat-containing protein C10orf11 homolog-like Protein [Tribolium castaneum]|uniref:Leucine-rich repeat-containing protein C10orf11 homolog-like Protein n=1 Tax=Tribolium castaneum TaxID=7070 RepID=D6WCN2_TRICA|nr:PREDICTED: uncharacterized protein LOC656166 isoform X1 [Tribolium castaneum]EEZ97805.1 Leucine-rich repeat-containing protein C10orf11 homolog-like Protein [Tribolium castaneum]|eukprot:XP_967804.1 PREDICTED: uncharacterized protein LOC656166 isoform X1 [Tribolium castaneum]